MNSEKVKTAGRFYRIIASGVVFLLVFASPAAGVERFLVASWNLENLFDLSYDGTEYPGYIPGGQAGWEKQMLKIKTDNLSRAIADLSPDVIGLQEVESENALKRLQHRLRRRGEDFPHAVIADDKDSTVKCALLSKYPVTYSDEIRVTGEGRSILRADLDVSENRLVVFVNHWKSKSGPESRRITYARALAAAAEDLPKNTDYILLGDFNSNYDEFRSIQKRPSLNDTGGTTGINHVIKTLSDGKLVDEKRLVKNSDKPLHYNLWLELPKDRRWSSLFFSRPGSPDAILLSAALYDGKGISYVDNSFDKFDPGYLFDGDELFRWQRADQGKGRHLGDGYSDHLPVYACFKVGSFEFSNSQTFCTQEDEKVSIADLYKSKTGGLRFKLRDCVVTYRHGDNAVIKQKNGRAVYVYKAAEDLKKGRIYEIIVSELKRYYGNLEITGIESLRKTGEIKNPGLYYIKDPETDLSAPVLENEIIGQYEGFYENGEFYYGTGKRIRLYFSDKSLKPEQGSRILVRHARIGYHKSPELVIGKTEQIKKLEP